MTEENIVDTPTSLQLVDTTIVEILRAPSEDVSAVLLAGWNGFTTLATVVMMLVEQWPDDDVPHRYVVARDHDCAASAVAVRYLERAPGLPPTDRSPQPVSGWVSFADISEGTKLSFDVQRVPAELAAAAIAVHGPHIVASRVPRLAAALNTGLAASIRYAENPADSKALTVGTAMASEICDAWQGRLRTFLTTSKDLKKLPRSLVSISLGPQSACNRTPPWCACCARLRERVADRDGWASIAQVGSAIRAMDPGFLPQVYGCPNLTRLIYATELFRTRKVNHDKGAPTVYIRAKQSMNY